MVNFVRLLPIKTIDIECRGGEIGRRTALRGQRVNARKSSSLFLGTIFLSEQISLESEEKIHANAI